MYGRADFVVGFVRAVVADLRIGQHHDLPGIGRIGEDFLVAGDRGIEDDFARAFDGRTKTLPSKTVPSSRARTAGFNGVVSSRRGSLFYFTIFRAQSEGVVR